MTRPILLLALAVLCVAGCVYADEPFNFYPEDSTYTTDSVFYRNNYTIIVVPTADIEAGIVPCECMRVLLPLLTTREYPLQGWAQALDDVATACPNYVDAVDAEIKRREK